MNRFRGGLAVFALAGLLSVTLAASPVSRVHARGVTCALTYAVQPGDWLSIIAQRLLGDVQVYPQIVDATNAQNGADGFARLADPNKLEIGDKLCIPHAENAPQGLDLDALANATYKAELGENGTITLTGGEFKKPAAPDLSAFIMMVLEDVAYGKWNGTDTAAVVTWTTGGGTARTYNLRLVQVRDGALQEIAAVEMGDNILVNKLAFANDKIVADMVQHGPGDAGCCATQHVVNTYALDGGALKLVSTTQAVSMTNSTRVLSGLWEIFNQKVLAV